MTNEIKAMTDSDIGRWVIYKPDMENERGRVKKFNNVTKTAWVVYKANGNWDGDHWKDYTAESTNYHDLVWV